MFLSKECVNYCNCNGTQRKINGVVLNECAFCSKAKKRILESTENRLRGLRENGK